MTIIERLKEKRYYKAEIDRLREENEIRCRDNEAFSRHGITDYDKFRIELNNDMIKFNKEMINRYVDKLRSL